MQKYLCSLGSNIKPETHFPQAQVALKALSDDIRFSRNIPTSPVDMETNNDFLNALFIIRTPMNSSKNLMLLKRLWGATVQIRKEALKIAP
jgi:2-amino-4-hydroxy-6-hydroxymethyldihydropteridine diphosphokinase